MSKKGFTLVEILAVIIIIGMILLLVIPKALDAVQSGKEKLYDQQMSHIENAAKQYIAKNPYGLVWKDNMTAVTLQTLIDAGLVKTPVLNPLTGEEFDADKLYVNATVNGGKGTYTAIYDNTNEYPLTIMRNKTYGGSSGDEPYDVIYTSDGGYVLLGQVDSTDGDITDGNNGGHDIGIIKIDEDGEVMWDKTYGGSLSDEPHSIIQTSDGGYLITGSTSSSSTGDMPLNRGSEGCISIKVDENGDKEWIKNFGGTLYDYCGTAVENEDSTFTILGGTQSTNYDITDGNNGGYDILLLKIDKYGAKIWDKTYGGSAADDPTVLISTSDDGYLIMGNSNSSISGDVTGTNSGEDDVWLIKTDSSGVIEWEKLYGGSGADLNAGAWGPSSLFEKPDGYVFFATSESTAGSGNVTATNHGNQDIWMVKTDKSGNIQWDKMFGGNWNEYFYTATETADGGYLLGSCSYSDAVGTKTEPELGWGDIWINRVTSDGNQTWDKTYGCEDDYEEPRAIINTPTGYMIIADMYTGNCGDVTGNSYGFEYEMYWTLKLDYK